MDWIGMAQHRDQWRALVNTVVNLRVPWSAGKFLSTCIIAAPQEGLSYTRIWASRNNRTLLFNGRISYDEPSSNKKQTLILQYLRFHFGFNFSAWRKQKMQGYIKLQTAKSSDLTCQMQESNTEAQQHNITENRYMTSVGCARI
jgi:hypothetical protein